MNTLYEYSIAMSISLILYNITIYIFYIHYILYIV